MMKKNAPLVMIGMTALLSAFTTVGLAQSNPPASSSAPASTPAAGVPANERFLQQFSTDAAVVDKQWWGVEFRWDRGAVPPFESADGNMLIGTVAISPFPKVEVGGTIPWIDYTLDNEIVRPGTTRSFDGDSGIGDVNVWGKYQIFSGPFSLSVGGDLSLPTGSEDQGLGSGEFTPGAFAGVRFRAQDGYFLGTFHVKFYNDATILNSDVQGKTATVVGGGYIWEGLQDWLISGEVTAASEPYEDTSSDIRATGGIQYTGFRHSLLRGGLGIGLSDGAPDFEVTIGYAYTF